MKSIVLITFLCSASAISLPKFPIPIGFPFNPVDYFPKLSGLLGGPKNVKPEEVEGILDKLRQNLYKLKGGEENLKLVQTDKVTELLVAGSLYTVSGICEDENDDQYTCTFTLWSRPWLPEPEKLIITLKQKEKLVKPHEETSTVKPHEEPSTSMANDPDSTNCTPSFEHLNQLD